MVEGKNLQQSGYNAAKWRMLLATMFCYLFYYTGRQTFGFAIPGIQSEFGFSKATLGWISASMLWVYAIGQFFNGNLADKFGGRRMMSLGAILSCGMNWLVSFGAGFWSLLFSWGSNGYFQAMGWAPGSRLLSNWWGRHERGKIYGFYVFAAGTASTLSFITSLLIVDIFTLNWRWIFRLPVLLLLVGGVVYYLIVRDRPEDLGYASPHDDLAEDLEAAENKESVTEGVSKGSEFDSEETSFQRYKAVLKNWRLLIAALSIGFQNMARYGLLIWVPVHFLKAGGQMSGSGTGSINAKWISVALPVGMALGAMTNGWVSDRLFNSRRAIVIMLFMAIGTIMSLSMYVIPAGNAWGIMILFLCGFFVYGPAACFWALCPDLVGHKRAGTATGVMNTFSYVFAGLGEPLIGKLIDMRGDTAIVFLVVATACFLSGTISLFIRR